MEISISKLPDEDQKAKKSAAAKRSAEVRKLKKELDKKQAAKHAEPERTFLAPQSSKNTTRSERSFLKRG